MEVTLVARVGDRVQLAADLVAQGAADDATGVNNASA